MNQDIADVYNSAEDEMYREKLQEVPVMRSNAIESILNDLFEGLEGYESHTERISRISTLIASKMGYKATFIEELKTASLYHDIGKIALLEDGDMKRNNRYKKHPEIGFRILNSSSDLPYISLYVFCHHERMNGTGYPRGLKGTDIPIQSRILYIAEVLEDRIFNNFEVSKSDIINELNDSRNERFDSNVVDVVLENIDEITDIIR